MGLEASIRGRRRAYIFLQQLGLLNGKLGISLSVLQMVWAVYQGYYGYFKYVSESRTLMKFIIKNKNPKQELSRPTLKIEGSLELDFPIKSSQISWFSIN